MSVLASGEAVELREAIARALDDDHSAHGFALGRVEHGEHRRMADLVLEALDMRPFSATFWDLRSSDGGVILSFSSREMSEHLAIERLEEWQGTNPDYRICTRTQTYWSTPAVFSDPEPYVGRYATRSLPASDRSTE